MAEITRAKNYLRYLMAFLVVGLFSVVGRAAPSWAEAAKAERSAKVFQEEFRVAQNQIESEKGNLWESIFEVNTRTTDSPKDSRLEFNNPKGWVDSPNRMTDSPAEKTNRSYDVDQVGNNGSLTPPNREFISPRLPRDIIGTDSEPQTDSKSSVFINDPSTGRSLTSNIESVRQLRGFIDTDLKEIEAKLSAGQELSIEETRFIITIENARKIDQVFGELQELKEQNKALLKILNSDRSMR